MGFTRTEDTKPSIKAVIKNIGLNHVEYDNGAQHRIVVQYDVLEGGDKWGLQTDLLNTGNELVVGGKEQKITLGMMNTFELEICGDIIVNGTIGGKARVWLDKLEELGYEMDELENTGDLLSLVGLEGEWERKTYSEAVGRKPNKDFTEKPFWMPVALTKIPEPIKSLEEEIFGIVDGKTEDEMIDWAKTTGKAAAEVIKKIDAMLQSESLKKEDNKYRLNK